MMIVPRLNFYILFKFFWYNLNFLLQHSQAGFGQGFQGPHSGLFWELPWLLHW
jgi:hypothetical protein